MRGKSTLRFALLGLAFAALAMVPVAAAGGPPGSDEAPRVLGVTYYKELEGIRNAVVADVKGKDPQVFAVRKGEEYDGKLDERINHGAGVDAYVIRSREFRRAVRRDFGDDGVAKFKIFAGTSGGVDRGACRLELHGDTATDNCR